LCTAKKLIKKSRYKTKIFNFNPCLQFEILIFIAHDWSNCQKPGKTLRFLGKLIIIDQVHLILENEHCKKAAIDTSKKKHACKRLILLYSFLLECYSTEVNCCFIWNQIWKSCKWTATQKVM